MEWLRHFAVPYSLGCWTLFEARTAAVNPPLVSDANTGLLRTKRDPAILGCIMYQTWRPPYEVT
jgi:hypothetical protein